MAKIKRKILFIMLLFLGLTLTLNMSDVSAVDSSSNGAATQSVTNTAVLNSSNTTNSTGYSEGAGASSTPTEIKVLIYNGIYSIGVCVTGIKTGLDSANTNNLVPGYHFTYGTATVINSATLAGYDVLAMPGGTDGDYYVSSSSISGNAIRNFVSNGGGYLGICAGAYSGVKQVVSSTHGNYNGWGVAPHVIATRPWVEGNVPVQIESAGQQLFGYGGVITMAHYNGPAMYASGGSIVTFATYADNSCYSKGLGAIVGDYYGLGRSVISGPHPELDPKYPDILGDLVVWAANKSANSIPLPTATISQITSVANSVKSQYETSKTLPNSLTVNNSQISIAQFSYLLSGAIVNLSFGSSSPVAIRNVDPASSSSGIIKSGNIAKSEFVSMAQNFSIYALTNGRAPNYVSSSLGNMSFENTVYMFSKILNYYQSYGRLPNYVSMAPSTNTTPTPPPTPTTASMTQVGSAAGSIKTYYESNKALPNTFTIAGQSINMPSLMYLLAKATTQANTSTTTAITIKTVDAATSPTGGSISGSISKTEFVNIAQNIVSSITTTNKAPNSVSTSLGSMNLANAVYMLSKIMNFYQTNSRLPNYVTM